MGTDLNELGKIRLIYPWTQDVNWTYRRRSHSVKSVRIRSYSGQYFLAFGLNKDQNNSECEHFLQCQKTSTTSIFTNQAKIFTDSFEHGSDCLEAAI